MAGILMLAGCSNGGTGYGAASTATPTPPGAGSAAATALVQVESTAVGSVLADSSGRTIYAFAADTPGHSTCSGACLTAWPAVAVTATGPTPPVGVSATLGVISRPEGGHQLTVNGWPAYTFRGDHGSGQVNGEGVNGYGGRWWAFATTGSWVTTTPGAPSPNSAASTSSSTPSMPGPRGY